jgi:hypothetical protein
VDVVFFVFVIVFVDSVTKTMNKLDLGDLWGIVSDSGIMGKILKVSLKSLKNL